MAKILEEVNLDSVEKKEIKSKKVQEYVKILKACDELDAEKRQKYAELGEHEREEVFEIIQSMYNIPEYLTVRETAELLNVTPQMVRKYCVNGKINAHQRLQGSGKWRIDGNQFMHHPNWREFLKKRMALKDQSCKVAEKMTEYLHDDKL